MNSKLTWGLAWAGLALIVAVPSADFLTGTLGGSTAAVVTSTTDPVKTGTVTTTRTANGITITPAGVTPADPVDKFLESGKTLPSYITDDGQAAPVVEPTKVAAIDPAVSALPAPVLVAPTPFPSWARPHASPAAPVDTTTTEPVVIVDEDAIGEAPPVQQPIILEEPDTRVARTGPVPPADIPEGDDNWDDEGLSTYLSQNGMLDDERSSATVTQTNTQAAQGNYDPDGFFLSDGPNNDNAAAARRAKLRDLFGDDCYDPDTGADICAGDAGTEPFELF